MSSLVSGSESLVKEQNGAKLSSTILQPLSREARHAVAISMTDNVKAVSPPSPSASTPVRCQEDALGATSLARSCDDDFAQRCDEFFNNPEKFLQDTQSELQIIVESFEQLHDLASGHLNQSLYYQELVRHRDKEIESLKRDLQESFDMKELHVKEMVTLSDTIQTLQKHRDAIVSGYHQEFTSRNELDRLRYEVIHITSKIILFLALYRILHRMI